MRAVERRGTARTSELPELLLETPSVEAPTSGDPAPITDSQAAHEAQDAKERPALSTVGGLPADVPRSFGEIPLASIGFAETAVIAVVLGAAGTAAMGAPLANAEAEAIIGEAADLDIRRATLGAAEVDSARAALWASWANASPAARALLVRAGTLDPLAAPISGPVGVGQANAKVDVKAVQERLAALGLSVTPDGQWGPQSERALRIFEAMIIGAEALSSTTGRMQPNDALHLALRSTDAPRWLEIPLAGPGFVRVDFDGHSFGSNMLVDVIRDSGTRYQNAVLAANPTKAKIGLNDASSKLGGPSSDHDSHQAGLDLDIKLPRTDGAMGTRVGRSNYDREAAYEMVAAFAADARVERILFTDTVLLARIAASNVPWKDKVVHGGPKHRNHIHVDVAPWQPAPPTPAAVG